MAKEKKKEESVSEEAEGATEEPKKKSKLMLIIAVVVVLIGGGAGAYFMGLFGGGVEGAEGESEPAKLEAQYINFKPEFVSNYRIDGRSRFLKVVVAVLVREDDVRLAVDKHMPYLRNQLVMLFGGADFEALKTLDGKNALREEALKVTQEVIQKELGKPGIEKVLFTDFVLQ